MNSGLASHWKPPFNSPLQGLNPTIGACQHKTRPSSASTVSLRARDSYPKNSSNLSEALPNLQQVSGSNLKVVARLRNLPSNGEFFFVLSRSCNPSGTGGFSNMFLPLANQGNHTEREKRFLVSAQPKNETVTLRPPQSGDERVKAFSFDKSSLCCLRGPSDAPFASQEDVYDGLGEEFLDHNFEGYNTLILVYGQPGSGKSHTMTGSPEDPGIIPRTCEDLFQRIESSDSRNVTHNVRVSSFEVSGERVRDLLRPQADSRIHNYLRVCESPTDGPYVKDLSEVVVRDYNELMECYGKGQMARSVEATEKGSGESSKSHFIFVIFLRQIYHDIAVDETIERFARIRFVDLAGPQKCESTSHPGHLFSNDNDKNHDTTCPDESFSTFQRVMTALADQPRHTGKRQKLIPYRDSALTWLLKDSLGGNSKTAVVACIAPDDYDGSLSTLRFAAQMRRVRTRPIINQDHFSAAERDAQLLDMAEAIRTLQVNVKKQGLAQHDVERQTEKIEEYQKQVAKMQLMMEETWMISDSKIRQLSLDNEALQGNLQLVLENVASANSLDHQSERSENPGPVQGHQNVDHHRKHIRYPSEESSEHTLDASDIFEEFIGCLEGQTEHPAPTAPAAVTTRTSSSSFSDLSSSSFASSSSSLTSVSAPAETALESSLNDGVDGVPDEKSNEQHVDQQHQKMQTQCYTAPSLSERTSSSAETSNCCSNPPIDEEVMDVQSQMEILLEDLSFFKLKVADDHKRFGIKK